MGKRRLVKLNLGCGQRPLDGYIGVDRWEGAAAVCDLLAFPWTLQSAPAPLRAGPLADRSVDEVICLHFVEHIPMVEVDGVDLLCAFMNELWRVMRPGGRATIQHPHAHSDRAWWDPTHRRCIPHVQWSYFNAEWRKEQGLDHYPIVADFDVVTVEGIGVANDVLTKHHEVQAAMTERQWNVIGDTKVILERRG